MMAEALNTCVFCTEQERIESPSIELKTCPNCKQEYCFKHASKVDPQYCNECCREVIVSDQVYTKTTEEYDEYNDEVILRNSRCRVIKLTGEHWKFYSDAIEFMTDEQLKISIQYHKSMVSKLEIESEQRKVTKLQNAILTNRRVGVVMKTTTETKTTKTMKPKQTVSIQQMAEMMKQLGITPEMIQALQKKG